MASQTKVIWRPFPLSAHVAIRNKGRIAGELPWLTFPTPASLKQRKPVTNKSPESGCTTALLGSVLCRCLCCCSSRPTGLVLQVTAALPTILPPPFSSAQLAKAQFSCCQWGSPPLDWVSVPPVLPPWHLLPWLCWFSPAVVAAVPSAPSPVAEIQRKQEGEQGC